MQRAERNERAKCMLRLETNGVRGEKNANGSSERDFFPYPAVLCSPLMKCESTKECPSRPRMANNRWRLIEALRGESELSPCGGVNILHFKRESRN